MAIFIDDNFFSDLFCWEGVCEPLKYELGHWSLISMIWIADRNGQLSISFYVWKLTPNSTVYVFFCD